MSGCSAQAETNPFLGLYAAVHPIEGPEEVRNGTGMRFSQRLLRYAADQIGQPLGSPIYFAVDYDASEADLSGGIADYFRGIAEGFAYPIGVYGSGLTCLRHLASGAAAFTWLAQASGWSGFHTFTTWNLKQGQTQTVLGLPIDLDESQGHGGGFQVAVVAV